MARAFHRGRRGIEARFDDSERQLLTRLVADVEAMLDDGGEPGGDPLAELMSLPESTPRPEDPALVRLLPDGSREDDEAAAEFRRLTERSVRSRKRQALRTVLATLDGTAAAGWDDSEGTHVLRLSDDEAAAWATSLTDVRLVLAERLGLRTDEDAESLHEGLAAAPEGDPRTWMTAVYDFLTWLQESLVSTLAQGLPEEGRREGG